jgi:hypothetical protein
MYIMDMLIVHNYSEKNKVHLFTVTHLFNK